MSLQEQPNFVRHSASLTIPELEQSKTAVLNTLASEHSRRSYATPSKGLLPDTERAQINVQPNCGGGVPLIPGTSHSLRRRD